MHGVAVGSMADVVHAGLAQASNDDIRALAIYFSDISGAGSQSAAIDKAASLIADAHIKTEVDMTHGGKLYAAACAACHYNSPGEPSLFRPGMSLNSAVSLASPDNLIRIVLDGVSVESGLPGIMMPGFARSMNDNDVADLIAFMRRTHSEKPPWQGLENRIAQLRDSKLNSDEAME
jgi:mono/diheme cytochrome c family protein